MFEDIEILRFLLSEEKLDPNSYIFIYSSHMGGLYYTEYRQRDTYCETCGDRDIEIDSGTPFDLLKKYMISILSETDYFKSIGYDIIRTIDLDELMDNIVVDNEEYCSGNEQMVLDDILNDKTKSYETRRGILEDALIGFLC